MEQPKRDTEPRGPEPVCQGTLSRDALGDALRDFLGNLAYPLSPEQFNSSAFTE